MWQLYIGVASSLVLDCAGHYHAALSAHFRTRMNTLHPGMYVLMTLQHTHGQLFCVHMLTKILPKQVEAKLLWVRACMVIWCLPAQVGRPCMKTATPGEHYAWSAAVITWQVCRLYQVARGLLLAGGVLWYCASLCTPRQHKVSRSTTDITRPKEMSIFISYTTP